MTDSEVGMNNEEWCKKNCPYSTDCACDGVCNFVLSLLKEQEELLKHEYWRGYNNGRADERGLQKGTIMQTFSPD